MIENKIGSVEHSNQLARYHETVQRHIPTATIIGLLLTPDGEEPADERYLPISYGLIAELIEGVATSRSSVLGPDVRMLLKHYTQMLRRHVVSGSDIDDLCQRIYRKHQRALDLTFERRPDPQLRMKEFLEGLIAQTPELIADRATKGGIGFSPSQWETILPRTDPGWSNKGRILLFWFENLPNRLRLILEIAEGGLDRRSDEGRVLQLDTPRNRRGWWSGKKTHEKTKEGPVRATDPSIVQYAHRRHRRADPLLICVTTAVIAKISLVRRRAEEDGP